MQKMKILLLLPALFISPYIMGMDTGSGSSTFKSLEEKLVTSSDIQPLIPSYAEGTSSGSGDDDKKTKPKNTWHWSQSDAFIMPENFKTKKSVVPKINLKPREEVTALTNQENRREKIKKNFGKKFIQESEKEEEVGAAIQSLKECNLDSARTRVSPSPAILPPITRKKRVLSHETVLSRIPSREEVQQPISTERSRTTPSSPSQSPREIVSKTLPLTPSPNPTPPISPNPTPPISPRTTPPISPRTNMEISTQQTSTQEKKDDTKIESTSQEPHPTSMRPFTWKDGGVTLLTLTGLLSLLYYLDKLPANITAKIDNFLATFKMQG